MLDCTFCGILQGELPASVVDEDDVTVAFLDIKPVNPGHTLVVPRRHVTSFAGLTKDEITRMISAAHRVMAAQRAVLHCAGATLHLADGEIAGQEVPHAHFHVIPRYVNDGFGLRLPKAYGATVDRVDLDDIANRLCNNLLSFRRAEVM